MKVKNNWNASKFPRDHEVNDLPSETVPDQALSVKEIMTRYARGIPLTESGRVPVWYSDQELEENQEIGNIPDLERLDISERMEILEQQKQRVVDLQKSLQRKKAKEDYERRKQEQEYKEFQEQKKKQQQDHSSKDQENRNEKK